MIVKIAEDYRRRLGGPPGQIAEGIWVNLTHGEGISLRSGPLRAGRRAVRSSGRRVRHWPPHSSPCGPGRPWARPGRRYRHWTCSRGWQRDPGAGP